MGPKPLWKRAAALLAAVGMSIFLAGGISADDENAEAEAARVLKPTQAIADIPQEYNELFEIQWGGGSLYHLKARLATMGCMLNTIWVYDNNRWFSYNQYNVPHTLNQAFITQFSGGIPATTLYASCIHLCTLDIDNGDIIEGKECTRFEDIVQQVWIPNGVQAQADGYPTIDDDAVCNDDFHPLVKERVFSLLPVFPDTCIVRQTIIDPLHSGGAAYGGYIVLWNRSAPFNNTERVKEAFRISKLHTEVHELCHIQQMYYLVQQAQLNQYIKTYDGLFEVEANKEFMDIVGFTENPEWNFYLPTNSIYKEIYSKDPVELSAELCTLYMLDKIGEKSAYTTDRTRPNFNPHRYLTPQVVEWLEKYMVLPTFNVGDE